MDGRNKMSVAIRFDDCFLNARLAKQKKWRENGIKTGSGKEFSDQIGTTATAGGLPKLTASNSNSSSYKKKKATRSKQYGDNPKISPHSLALAALSKNPKLRSGGVVNGKKKASSHEHWEQVLFFDWLYIEQAAYYMDFVAIPNGGIRDNRTAASLLAEGAKSGYPDIVGDVAKGAYHGIFIELKFGKNKPSKNQIAFLNRKRERGYFSCVCYGCDEAVEAVKEYLALLENSIMKWNKNELCWLVDSD